MTAEQVKPYIYDKTAKLSQYFISYIKQEGVPDNLLPLFTDNGGYRFDWNIVGGEEVRNYFEPYRMPITKKYFFSLNQRIEVQKLVNRLSCKIFLPELMTKNAIKTDQVQLRIAVAMLDKINIPTAYRSLLFDNFLYCYWVRKRAYDTFFWKEIIQFPFAPDYHYK